MEEHVTLLAAFGAGFLSFISPCVLPLIPGYLSYISGQSLDQMRGTGTSAPAAVAVAAASRQRVVLASVAFIIGFSLVFIALGASATAVGHFLITKLTLIRRVTGAIVIVFGLHTMGWLPIGWLYREKRLQAPDRPTSLLGAMIVGVAFAFGWTPCLGPILAGILAMAATQDTVIHGVRLLAVYSLGLAVPFFATALAINRFFAAFARIRKHFHAIELTSGALLVAIGVLIFTNRFTILAQWLTPYLPVY